MESAKEEIQSYWEVASITHFCHLFKKKLKLPPFDYEVLENALLEPVKPDGDDTGELLINQIMLSLVAGYFGPTHAVDNTSFDQYFRELIDLEWVQNDGLKNPLIHVEIDENGEESTEWIDFHSLHVRTKVQILYKLCDYRLAAQDSSEFVKDAIGKLRQKPIGIDSLGYVYWYFHGVRLYREKPRVAKILVEKLREPMKPVNGSSSPNKESTEDKSDVKLRSPTKEKPDVDPDVGPDVDPDLSIVPLNGHKNGLKKTMASGLKNQSTLWNWLKKAQSKPEPKSTTGVPVSILKESWSVVCHNVEDWRKLIERLRHSLSLPDRELAERFKLTYLPKAVEVEEAILKRKRAEERAMLRALIPKRYSERIQEKLSKTQQISQTNVIESKLRNRDDRDKLRELYREACGTDEIEKKKREVKPEFDINHDSIHAHKYSTRRNRHLPADKPSDGDETSQTSGVGSVSSEMGSVSFGVELTSSDGESRRSTRSSMALSRSGESQDDVALNTSVESTSNTVARFPKRLKLV